MRSSEKSHKKNLSSQKGLKMSQPLRIERPDLSWFLTSRCINSELLFWGDKELEQAILGTIAKNAERQQVKLYALVLMGNHYHDLAQFPLCNRASFKRNVNSQIAKHIKSRRESPEAGQVFGRRYSAEAVPEAEDIKESFFYCALQPVAAGLTEDIRDFPLYNSFLDAIHGKSIRLRVFKAAEYNERKRFNKSLNRELFYEEYELSFARLPGYENLTQEQYAAEMLAEYEKRRLKIIEEKKSQGFKYPSIEKILATPKGARPRKTKTSKRNSFRPLVLTKSSVAKHEYLRFYFETLEKYRLACARYLSGDNLAEFPAGTYKPPGPLIR